MKQYFTVAGNIIEQKLDNTLDCAGEYCDNEISYNIENIENIRETVIHELIHAILQSYSFVGTSKPQIKGKTEEQLVSILSKELDHNWKMIESTVKKLST